MVETIVPRNEWSVAIRLNHWATVISIGILIVTGFYIADPFTVSAGETVHKFLMGDIRFCHIFFGIVLVFLFLWRVYLAFFSRFHADWRDFFAWTDTKSFINQAKIYLLISRERPDHRYLYGPPQSLAYGGVLLLLFLIVLTGLTLFGAGYQEGWTSLIYTLVKPFENLVGGLAMVRWIHHILMWCLILFIVVHVYMAFWDDAVFQEGLISSMVSGKVFRKNQNT